MKSIPKFQSLEKEFSYEYKQERKIEKKASRNFRELRNNSSKRNVWQVLEEK
jgi:hypothetical protein